MNFGKNCSPCTRQGGGKLVKTVLQLIVLQRMHEGDDVRVHLRRRLTTTYYYLIINTSSMQSLIQLRKLENRD